MITSLLVANRGEIARRIFRTARDAGLTTVAVYSDPDANALHVLEADLGVPLSGASPSETYLRGDLIVAAALAAGADAIHPGYGFLSENADFARAVLGAGLIWVGPPPSAMEAMSSKVDAKKLMAGAGVPVLGEVDRTDPPLPLIIKAAAGGGGRGMRIVRSAQELAAQWELASAEAQSAFGDPTVFCEPYIESGHHIEVQILADAHGTVWALGERECSVQRRHQKVIEETPSPLVDRTPGLRDKLFEAAVAAARAVGYVGAGTVEFLVSADGSGFYFLEMNTRLQVEHPVTEEVTGLDLVALQLDVANGLALPVEPPAPRGHAIEARLYAEDPAADWQPQTGALHRFEISGPVRVDAGYGSGDVIGVHYDAMLAKVIAYSPTRAAATAKLAGVLRRARLYGVPTNRDLLVRTLQHPAFVAGTADTGFLQRHVAELSAPLADRRIAALAAAVAQPVGWRNVPSQPVTRRFGDQEITFRLDRAGLTAPDFPAVLLLSRTEDEVVLEIDGVRQAFLLTRHDDFVYVDSPHGSVALQRVPRFTDPAAQTAPGTLAAPMPGTVVDVAVALGDSVQAGQPLLRLEAMKMQHTVNAPAAGIVIELFVHIGQQVDAGARLVVVSQEEQ